MHNPSSPPRGAYCPADGCPDCRPRPAPRFRLEADPWRLTPVAPLVGLTAGEAEAELDRLTGEIAAGMADLGKPVFRVHDPALGSGHFLRELDQVPHLPEDPDCKCLLCQGARRPGLLARTWTRIRQAWCDHAAATSHRIPGATPPAYERRCGRCKATWSWREER